ncbi:MULTISPECIES: hypothetical protein [Bifidobacterium]|uniref:Uncharacterized protein n=1 Tax=Bifidobacterium reuteri DSM 23975 TaxID=1437610 RepID=A0A087CUX5_9BIFI|nr:MULTISPECIES: hypothetical protein [Bifidobacterium]KFI87075.1 hypothetical protein BREU_0093 [Bifidobacterium reuteri DSM 23975]
MLMYLCLSDTPMWTDVAQGVSAIIGAVGVVLTLIFTACQIHQASVQVRESSKQSQRESEDRNRPYISMDVIPSIGGSGAWDLKLKNTGGTAARSITIRLVNQDFIMIDDNHYISDHLRWFMETPFDLMPEASKRVYWIITDGQGDVVDGAPLQGKIEVHYSWRREADRKDYCDSLTYDCIKAPIPAAATGPTHSGGDNPELKNIEHAIRGISRQLGEISR